DVTDPDEHLRVALSLGHAWEGLWDQDGVHLLAPERLERRAHRLERGDLDVAEVLLDDDGRERITGPLPPLVGDDPDPLTAQDDVVEGGRQPGRADVDLAGGQRGGDGRRRLEKGQLDVHALLLEEALLHSDEARSRRGELEDPHANPLGCLDGAAGHEQNGREHQDAEHRARGCRTVIPLSASLLWVAVIRYVLQLR